MALSISQLKNLNKLGILNSIIIETGKRWNSKYFLTTPIFYVNADPHIGHLYTAVIGDATVRFQKLKNPDVETKFMVGTDEHGLKVSQSAQKNKMSVEAFCENVSLKYKELFSHFSVEADDFLRTTEERHLKAASALWNKIYSKDLIYKDKYSGWYSVSDEMFVSEFYLDSKIGKNGERYTLEENKPVNFMEETNYKFKLSKFQNDLLHWLKKDVVKPKLFQEKLTSWIEEGEILKDMSVSRPAERVSWGIPVPGDSSQTIYVWLDALSSYLCSNGYPESSFKWPPDLQIIGKDILRFHGVFWPAFLMAADLEPPKCILCHSHWMKGGEKMSKSKGNVVDPFEQSKLFTSDGFRFFLLREGVPHNDGNFSYLKVMNILNAELANSLGNLLSRCTGSKINTEQIFPKFSEENFQKYSGESGKYLINSLEELPDMVVSHFEEFNFYKGVDNIIATLHLTNKFFQDEKPWESNKNPEKKGHLNYVLHLSLESLRVCGILLQPIIPNISRNLLDKLSIGQNKRNLKDIRPFSWESSEDLKTTNLNSEKVILFKKLEEIII